MYLGPELHKKLKKTHKPTQKTKTNALGHILVKKPLVV